MPRKFISFLGAIPYHQTRYYRASDRSDMSAPLYYLQEAILRNEGPWGTDDKIIIFTTDEALRNNYNNRIYSEDGSKKLAADQGLSAVLKRLKNEGVIQDYDSEEIPNGYSESEIWTVFERVLEQLQPNDEVVFDIIFGFRSLPMLVMVLLNYAKTLHEVKVQAIYYGNYEAGRAEKEQRLQEAGSDKEREQISRQIVEAPILDLKPFAILQDWTYAAQSFLWVGNAQRLSDLTAATHQTFSKGILAFTQAILTCRGFELIAIQDINSLKDDIAQLGGRPEPLVQLKLLLEKVQDKLTPFKSKSVENGFAAVGWCIKQRLIQQGITFLQETLKTMVVERVAGMKYVTNYYLRYAANDALNGIRNPQKTIEMKNEKGGTMPDSELRDFYNRMHNWVKGIPGLTEAYKKLTGDEGFRNDINHCGYNDPYMSPDDLERELSDLFDEVKSLIS